MSQTQRTLVILKPDAVQRQLVGEILGRLEAKGLKIVGLKMVQISQELARRMYAVHEGKEFYEPLVEFMTASPAVTCVLEGIGAIAVVRKLVGATFCPDAEAGTIRGDLGMSRRYNLVHASDSPESAATEIPVFFSEDELMDYSLVGERWIYADWKGEKI